DEEHPAGQPMQEDQQRRAAALDRAPQPGGAIRGVHGAILRAVLRGRPGGRSGWLGWGRHGSTVRGCAASMGHVIAITRYRVPIEDAETFTEQVDAVLRALSACPGYLSGRLGRTVDDPTLWALISEWEGAGFYRRGIGAYDVRMLFIPLSVLAIDEPGAYE